MVKESAERDRFIESNLGLVHSLCRRFSGRGIEYDDLYQAGCVGLVKATDAFEEERGLCFSTYAVPVILGEIRRLFRDGGAVKVSRSLKELSLRVLREKERQEKRNGREPTVSELAQSLGIAAEEVTEALCAAQPTVSLTYDGEDGTAELDLPVAGPEEQLSDRLYLLEGMKRLTDSERRIISCRYFHALTQSRTAELLSMTQVQVSRAERKILAKLRATLGEP